jgi:hypothetical protein
LKHYWLRGDVKISYSESVFGSGSWYAEADGCTGMGQSAIDALGNLECEIKNSQDWETKMLIQPHPLDVNLVLFHRDMDGFAAAWAAWKLLGKEATYISVQYGEEPPDVTGKNVAVLDFSYSGLLLDKVTSQAQSLVMLDHHKSVADFWPEGHPNLVSDLYSSGAVMSWQWFHPGEPLPQALSYVQDYDLWLFKFPETRMFHQGINHISYKAENFGDLSFAFDHLDDTIQTGKTLCQYIDAHAKRDMKKAVLVEILPLGQKVWMLNSHSPWYSEVANLLATQGLEVDVACVWTYLGRDGTLLCSLRSKETDVSLWAKQLGGGGHAHAAGFVWRGTVESLFSTVVSSS